MGVRRAPLWPMLPKKNSASRGSAQHEARRGSHAPCPGPAFADCSSVLALNSRCELTITAASG